MSYADPTKSSQQRHNLYTLRKEDREAKRKQMAKAWRPASNNPKHTSPFSGLGKNGTCFQIRSEQPALSQSEEEAAKQLRREVVQTADTVCQFQQEAFKVACEMQSVFSVWVETQAKVEKRKGKMARNQGDLRRHYGCVEDDTTQEESPETHHDGIAIQYQDSSGIFNVQQPRKQKPAARSKVTEARFYNMMESLSSAVESCRGFMAYMLDNDEKRLYGLNTHQLQTEEEKARCHQYYKPTSAPKHLDECYERSTLASRSPSRSSPPRHAPTGTSQAGGVSPGTATPGTRTNESGSNSRAQSPSASAPGSTRGRSPVCGTPSQSHGEPPALSGSVDVETSGTEVVDQQQRQQQQGEDNLHNVSDVSVVVSTSSHETTPQKVRAPPSAMGDVTGSHAAVVEERVEQPSHQPVQTPPPQQGEEDGAANRDRTDAQVEKPKRDLQGSATADRVAAESRKSPQQQVTHTQAPQHSAGAQQAATARQSMPQQREPRQGAGLPHPHQHSQAPSARQPQSQFIQPQQQQQQSEAQAQPRPQGGPPPERQTTDTFAQQPPGGPKQPLPAPQHGAPRPAQPQYNAKARQQVPLNQQQARPTQHQHQQRPQQSEAGGAQAQHLQAPPPQQPQQQAGKGPGRVSGGPLPPVNGSTIHPSPSSSAATATPPPQQGQQNQHVARQPEPAPAAHGMAQVKPATTMNANALGAQRSTTPGSPGMPSNIASATGTPTLAPPNPTTGASASGASGTSRSPTGTPSTQATRSAMLKSILNSCRIDSDSDDE